MSDESYRVRVDDLEAMRETGARVDPIDPCVPHLSNSWSRPETVRARIGGTAEQQAAAMRIAFRDRY